MSKTEISLYNLRGERKYLNLEERLRFVEAANDQVAKVRLFCLLLYYTGARITEVHNLVPRGLDHANGSVIIETLKKRRKGIFREIPVPHFLLKDLQFYIIDNQINISNRLWPFSLRTASRKIKAVMTMANIDGVKSSARGLRHGFAVHAVTLAPLTLVKKWLGHSRLETTEIYLNVMGNEEREFSRKVWGIEELRATG